MRIITFPLLILTLTTLSASEIPTENLWTSLAAKRGALTRVHQEFDITQTTTSAHGTNGSKRQSILDLSPGLWREKSVSRSGSHVRIFDGQDILSMEEGGDEFVRTKRRAKSNDPIPGAYNLSSPDWPRAKEIERVACNLPGVGHQCVVIEIPLKPGIVPSRSPQNPTRVLGGVTRVALDLETGLLVSSRTLQSIENRNGGYKSEVLYSLKKLSYGGPSDATLFKLPSADMAEVKELTRWNAAKIKKRLGGQPAPELSVTDIKGNPISLSELKGKTVLLDFWTTWCPPCRADAPSLDKLFKKYGAKNFTIVSISVSEDRAVVEKFLGEHPHSYPIVLSTENDIPRPYQIGTFPTYLVIDPDGTLASAVEGDQGFAELRKLLKKAGLDTE